MLSMSCYIQHSNICGGLSTAAGERLWVFSPQHTHSLCRWDAFACHCLPTVHCPGLVQSCPHLQMYGTVSVSPLHTAQALSSPVHTPTTPVWDCHCLPTAHCPGLVQSCPHSFKCKGLSVSPHCTLPRPCPHSCNTWLGLSVSPHCTLSSPVHAPSTPVWDTSCPPYFTHRGKYNTILLAGKEKEKE